MKAKHVFTTLGIALTMGLGVVAGLSHAKAITPAKAEQTSWYVVGEFGGVNKWSHSTGYAMTETSTNVWVKEGLTFAKGDAFKVCDEEDKNWQGGWSYNNGASPVKTYFTAENDGANIVCQTAGTYDITFTKSDWHIKVEVSGETEYSVTVNVDGALRGVESVKEGSLPVSPTITEYGKAFSGWFDDAGCTAGHEVTSITSDTTVYGKTIVLPKVTYNLDVSRVDDLSAPYLYAYESGGRENAKWPGINLNGATSFEVPNDATIVITNAAGNKQTVNITQSGVANDTLRLLSDLEDSKYTAVWTSTLDEPAEDGYYLVGSKTSFKYAGAPKMTQVDPALTGNVAVLYDYEAALGEKIKARSFFSSVDKWSQNADTAKDYGEADGDGNFVFSKAGHYDIYAFYSGDDFKFSVAEAAEQVTVTLVAQKFEGATARGGETIDTVQVVSGQKYTVPTHAISGWRQDGAFTNNTCTEAYDDTVALTENTIIYVRYMKIGFFRIAGADSWSIYAANAMITEGIADSNKAEDTVVVAAANETYSFVYYDENGALSGQNGLGAEYDFAVYEDSHIKFTKAGTYAVYWNKTNNLVYLNAGATAFYTGFISEIGGICQNDGSTNIESLQAAWLHQKAVYNTLDDDEKATIVAKTINGGNKDGDLLEQVIAKYHYIVVERYGTGVCEDFIWGHTYPSNQMNPTWPNVAFIVIVSVSSALLVAGVSTLILLKRKKHF